MVQQSNRSALYVEKLSRYRGCLLGGAVGDALGYPVEFMGEKAIWSKYGSRGIQTLAQAGCPAEISDDTQMTLFAANGILYGLAHRIPQQEAVWLAYQEWLGTQGDTSRMENPKKPKMWLYREPRLHNLRAPGNTCLASIRTSPSGGTVQKPINNSKGCGTVMRAAPFGLAVHYDPKFSRGDDSTGVFKMAISDAALTHGHPLGYYSAACLALMIFNIVQYRPGGYKRLEDAVLAAGRQGNREMVQCMYPGLERAVNLALDSSVSDLEGIHALGEGWVAEEALYIAVFCAVRYQNDFAAAIRTAVNHKGDSDSTGAVCGNLLGAWLGKEAVEAAFDLKNLELQDVVETIADDLCAAVEGDGIPSPWALERYQR